MTVLKTTQGDALQCDGCGRTDAGPGMPLSAQPYSVHDPNVGGHVTHHYCGMCARNRGAQLQELSVPWAANNVLPATPEEALVAELPMAVEQAIEVAEQVEERPRRKSGKYD